jgi:hypothetical protein
MIYDADQAGEPTSKLSADTPAVAAAMEIFGRTLIE